MVEQLSLRTFIFNILTLLLIGCTLTGSLPVEGNDDASGYNPIAQRAFGKIIERRSEPNHDQVVNKDSLGLEEKENKAVHGLTQEEKDYLLQVHNAYRSAVQPYAANMMEMVWDDDIASFAQSWADQCQGRHRGNRDFGPWINMGENIFWSFGAKYHEGLAAKWWWDEVQWYNFTSRHCEPGQKCGHYVTMVWASSSRLGCGLTRCQGLDALPELADRGAYYFVCNYNGRFFSHTDPYHEHASICSYCYATTNTRCRYNLCVTQEMLDNDIGYNGSTAEIGLDRKKTHSSRKSRTTSRPTLSSPATTLTTKKKSKCKRRKKRNAKPDNIKSNDNNKRHSSEF